MPESDFLTAASAACANTVLALNKLKKDAIKVSVKRLCMKVS
jgi:hypothetical protein